MKKPISRRLVLLGAFGMLCLIIATSFYRIHRHSQQPLPSASAPAVNAEVTVINAVPGRYHATIQAYGTATARYQLTLTPKVSGEILDISDAFEVGQLVAKGQILAAIDNRNYVAALAAAERTLAESQLALLQEEREGEQARQEWQSSGIKGNPNSELVLRKPQLLAAQATAKEAQAKLASARRDVENTLIRAPFNGLIVNRDIAPGETVQLGASLGAIYSSDQIEVTLPLSARDWGLLGSQQHLETVTLTHVETGQQWQGQLIRQSLNVDQDTRQRDAIVAVTQPLQQQPALLSGTFVKATLHGISQDQLWRLPSSALSQRGEIWYVDDNSILQKIETTAVFSDQSAIYIAVPEALQHTATLIVAQPLSSYLVGTRVTTRDTAGNTIDPATTANALTAGESKAAVKPVAHTYLPVEQGTNHVSF